MTAPTTSIPVRGSLRHDPDGLLLVLDRRLDGYDTFLSGALSIGPGRVRVRIISLDDVTVLRPMEPNRLPPLQAHWDGILHLPHGLRSRAVPGDLARAAEEQGRTLQALDAAEMRYALTFLGEATTSAIRQGRIRVIVSALPPQEKVTA